MQIALARIDDRLIHGRVATVWSRVTSTQRVVIYSDDVFNDEVCRTLLRRAASPDTKVNVVSLEKVVVIYHNPQYQSETVFYLFASPYDVLTMMRQGV